METEVDFLNKIKKELENFEAEKLNIHYIFKIIDVLSKIEDRIEKQTLNKKSLN